MTTGHEQIPGFQPTTMDWTN